MGNITSLIAITAIIGAGIQELLELFDPIISCIASKISSNTSIDKVTQESIKKSISIFITTILGILIVKTSNLSLLGLIDNSMAGNSLDIILTSLLIGADAELANSAQKLVSGIKDNTKT